MSKFPAGPWVATKSKHGIDGGRSVIAFVISAESTDDMEYIIHAECEGEFNAVYTAEFIADAPALLEALKDIYTSIVYSSVAYEFDDAMLEEARALIAKHGGGV